MVLSASFDVQSPQHTQASIPIPISMPAISDAEVAAVVDVLRSGNLAQGDTVAEFERAFAAYIGAGWSIATSSGTTALHLALLANGIGPGDEVITSPFSFIATGNVVRYVGATPVFADIDPVTLNLSPREVERKITSRTRAILPVHLYGNPCDMGELMRLADAHGLAVIEDACQAHGASYAGRRVGTFGTGCFSFYATKNMTCGEGGMITTSDPVVAERAKLLRAHWMQATYTHDRVGYNFRMTNIHAAIGLAQLPRLDELNARRAANAAFYDAQLEGTGVRRIGPVDDRACTVWHQYTLLLEAARRDAIAARLRSRGVAANIYYPVPIHRQRAYADFATADCPVADEAAARVLSIPVHPGLSLDDRARVVEEVLCAVADN